MSYTILSNRIYITEESQLSISNEADRLGVSFAKLKDTILKASNRVAKLIRFKNGLQIINDNLTTSNIAGIFRLSDTIDIEIKPKFLDNNNDNWREDFFFISELSKFGEIITNENLSYREDRKNELADLIGHAMINMFDSNTRKPLRTYRNKIWTDFNVDGEILDEFLLSSDYGFIQKGLKLDKDNEFNKTILLGMISILPEIRDLDLSKKLMQCINKLSPQSSKLYLRKKPLPLRHRNWQELYNLAYHTIGGNSLYFGTEGYGLLPGYLIKSFDTWENLINISLRSAALKLNITNENYHLGEKIKPGLGSKRIFTYPDITLKLSESKRVIVDAKYKAESDGYKSFSISASDVYEAIAFLISSGNNIAVLVYPKNSANEDTDVTNGVCSSFQVIEVGNFKIIGMFANPLGISKPKGFSNFSNSLAEGIINYLD